MSRRPQFPTKDGCMWKPQGLFWAQMCAVYGDSLVIEECQKANLWLLKNPGKWKTCNGMPRFLNTWMARAAVNVRPAAKVRFEPGIYNAPPLDDDVIQELRGRIQ